MGLVGIEGFKSRSNAVKVLQQHEEMLMCVTWILGRRREKPDASLEGVSSSKTYCSFTFLLNGEVRLAFVQRKN